MSSTQSIVQATRDFVQTRCPVEPTGHDWHHAFRVAKTALFIAHKEGGDLLTVELAALLHDVEDWKFSQDGKTHTDGICRFLLETGCDLDRVEQVEEIIKTISFKGAKTSSAMTTLEGKIVQDADRLDAIGPMGVARSFAYGGFKGQPMHDPSVDVCLHQDFESYKKHKGTTLNHFYEKLLLIEQRLHTQTAKQIGKKHHQYLEHFVSGFMQQWEAEYE